MTQRMDFSWYIHTLIYSTADVRSKGVSLHSYSPISWPKANHGREGTAISSHEFGLDETDNFSLSFVLLSSAESKLTKSH